MATNYLDMVDAVRAYYGSGSDQWASIAQYGVTDQNWQYLKQVPGVTVTISESGKYLGYDYVNPFPATTNPGAIVDSNVQTGQYGVGSFDAQLPSTAVVDQQTGLVTQFNSGVKTVSSGATIASVADKVSLGVAGVALGTKLGALIDGAIYSIDPDWWDEHYPTINPATWDDMIAPGNETGQWVVRSIFGLPDDQSDNGTLYMDERLLAYTYAMMLEEGVWASGGEKTIINENPDITVDSNTYHLVKTPIYQYPAFMGKYYGYESNEYLHTIDITSGKIDVIFCCIQNNDIQWYFFSTTPYTANTSINTPVSNPYSLTVNHHVYNNKDIYYSMTKSYNSNFRNSSTPIASQVVSNAMAITEYVQPYDFDALAYLLLYQSIIVEESPVEGISPSNPEASTHITPSNVINQTTGNPVTPQDSIDDILQALKIAYPALFADELYEDVVQPDGTIDRITYTPVPYPDMEDPTKPVTDTTEGVDPQTNPEYNPETRPEGQTQGLTDSLTESPTTPDTGSGTTPPFLPPDGTANALYAIYNPSQSELNSFGAWLWSSNFVDQLLKLFNDPMQAIIGLHKVFVNPVISGRQNIKVGYLDSGVASNVVGAQYVTVDCGSVTIPEYFGNVFDYDPFTQIYLYLPFVGIQRLDTGDVMRGTLNVVYHCDVLTGACLVEVNVFRDGGGGIIYTYTGNCAVQYPISSGSYMGIIASLASVVGGVVGTIATGGALAPVALGAVSGVMNAHTRVEHSGGFSGNAGAMGIKKPYVIITRPQTCLADNFPAFNGYPANKLTYIGDCTGYIKCDECHVEQVPGTDSELSELENLLKSGIII